MNRNPILDPTLQEILQVIKPTRADWDTRITVIDQLRNVLQSVESLRGVVVMAWSPLNALFMLLFSHYLICLGFVRCYCSTVWILCLKPLHKMGRLRHLRRLVQRLVNLVHRKEAETDFTWTVTSSNESFRCEERLLKTFFFLSFQQILILVIVWSGLWYRLQFVIHARVPILKVVSGHQRISCDISIDNLEGLLKSRFLFWISEIDGRFRDLVLLVKEWAKTHDINNPKNGTFNSYSLSLLVIFHLQVNIAKVTTLLLKTWSVFEYVFCVVLLFVDMRACNIATSRRDIS